MTPQGVTEHEDEQLTDAFRAVEKTFAAPLTVKARAIARRLFAVGWVMGVRSGQTGPALADVPLPAEDIKRPLSALVSLVRAARHGNPDQPQLGQRVEYHGTLPERHGRYWVTGIEQTLSTRGTPRTYYRLSKLVDGRYVHVLFDARDQSITPLPEYRLPYGNQ